MTTTQFIQAQMEDDREAWRTAHVQAMKCRDLEETLQRGLAIFNNIRRADEIWTRKIETGDAQFDEGIARELHSQYAWWVEPCDRILRCVEGTEKQNFGVERAGEFRQACMIARTILELSVEDLVSSAQEIARGELHPLGVVLDAH